MRIDLRGGFYSGPVNVEFVCDVCGEKALGARVMSWLRWLRERTTFTVTSASLVGGHLELQMCPVCKRGDRAQDLERLASWLVVDIATGQAVCDDCLRTVDPNGELMAFALRFHALERMSASPDASFLHGSDIVH
jgi:hypothetical protein